MVRGCAISLRECYVAVLALALFGACTPEIPVGRFYCDPAAGDDECPPGWRCEVYGAVYACAYRLGTEEDCGNGVLDPGEQCDPFLGRPDTCEAFGLSGESLCNLDCTVRCSYVCGDGVVHGDELCDDGNSVSGDGCSERCQPETLDWQLQEPTVSPPPRSLHGMAYDIAHDRVVLFGGRSPDGAILCDTWLYDGTSWYEPPLAPGETPPCRSEHAMAFDEERGVTVLFGGQGPTSVLDDVWEFDGEVWRPGTSGLPGLFGAAMADVPTGGVVLTGGFKTGVHQFPGSWLYEGTWQQLHDALPWQRAYTAMASSPSAAWSRFVLVHGGVIRGMFMDRDAYADTWYLLGTDWAQRDLAGTAPARQGHAMAFLPRWDKMLIFGGADNVPTIRGDVWIFSIVDDETANWHRIPGLTPPPRWNHRMVLDTRRGRILLFGGDGGEDGGGKTGDLWAVE